MSQDVSNPPEPMTAVRPEPGGAEARRRPRRRLVRFLGLGVLLGLLGLGIPLYRQAMSHESTDDAAIEAHAVPVSPRVAGHVARVLVADNQRVAAGQVLVAIDPRDFQAALDAAQAKETAARAAVVAAEAQAGAAQSRLTQARADLASQRDILDLAKANTLEAQIGSSRDAADLTRMQSLVRSNAVARQEFDHARATSDISRAKVHAANRMMATQADKIAQSEAAFKVAEDSLLEARAQLDARKADLAKAAADTEQARLNLSYTTIVAPYEGYVTKRSVESGAYVQVGQGLLSIVRPKVWVVANFKETQLTRMRPGQPVDIDVDVYPDVVFHGHVDSIQRGTGARFSLLPPENATGNFIKVVQRVPVKIVFDRDANLDKYLLAPGMSVVPSVDVAVPESAAPGPATAGAAAPAEASATAPVLGRQQAEAATRAPRLE